MDSTIPSPLPQTMMAATVHQFGPPAVITIEEVPLPVPGPGEVLVQVTHEMLDGLRARPPGKIVLRVSPGRPA